MPGRIEHDRLHPAAGGLLALARDVKVLPDPRDGGLESVAALLELGQGLQAGAVRAAKRWRSGGAGEGARHMAGELLLEPGDLIPQRRACRPLVDV
ncbi:MAG: hypothetical protein ACRDJY_11570, partial [Thermoleophilaceae bacterium]